jgi:hypothetical protein
MVAAPSPPRRLGLPWILLAVLANLIAAIVGFTLWEATLAAPRDEAPGFRVDIGPYVVTKGCPIRHWAAGEYLPAACLMQNTFYPSQASRYGLEYVYRSRGLFHRHAIRWVRQGNDALGVMCPRFSPCLIETVVSDRFLGPPASAARDADSGDFSHEPLSFRIGFVFDILLGVMPLAVMLFLYLNQPAVAAGGTDRIGHPAA